MNQEQWLTKYIADAFAGVQLDDGVDIHAAESMDDYGNPAEDRLSLTAEREDWQRVDGETLLLALDDVAVSSGSACTSASVEPSYVLRALGVPDDVAHASLRFTVGRYTTEQEVDYAATRVAEVVQKLLDAGGSPAGGGTRSATADR